MTVTDRRLAATPLAIAGSGGSLSKGSSGGESPNTARSKAIVRQLHLLGEGELALAHGEKSVFFGNVPLMADDGVTYNFKGVSWWFNPGVADQDPLPGFSEIEDMTSYGAEVKKAVPVVQEITNDLATSARVTIRLPALVYQKKSDSKLQGNSVTFRIEVKPYGGAWVNPFGGDITISEKFTSAYDKDYRFTLPRNLSGASHPWSVRVTRVTDDANPLATTPAVNSNQTYFQALTAIVEYRLSYPHTAHLGLLLDTALFGTSLPTISFDVARQDGLVPSNRNNTTRAYSGIWDGTLVAAPNDNPAWALYDLLANRRFGMGRHLDDAALAAAMWELYEIGRYCDEMVPDGFGGTEPRHTFNAAITSQRDALELVDLVASAFRGMVFYSAGVMHAVADTPAGAASPAALATPANVIEGTFAYSGTALKARHTVVAVTWNDPANNYLPAVEVVEDAEGIARYGRVEKPGGLVLIGCNSRGEARRAGLWYLNTCLHETDTVTYAAGFDHAHASDDHGPVVPGDVVLIQDPAIAGVSWSGRLLDATTTSLTLDRSVTLEAGKTYAVRGVASDGSLITAAVSASPGVTNVLSLAVTLPSAPLVGAVWMLGELTLQPRPFRVLAAKEGEGDQSHIVEITGLFNDVTKYDRIDQGVALTPATYTKLTPGCSAPRNLAATETRFVEDGVAKSSLTLSWSPPSQGVVASYSLTVSGPEGTQTLTGVLATSRDFVALAPGDYAVSVQAIATDGRASPAAALTATVTGWGGGAVPSVGSLALVSGVSAYVFAGKSPAISWVNTLDGTALSNSVTSPIYSHNTVTVKDGDDLVTLGTYTALGDGFSFPFDIHAAAAAALSRSPSRKLRFDVTVTDVYGRTSSPATITVSNPVPASVTPSVSPTLDGIIVSIPTPDDADFAGLLVWVSATSGFDPSATDPVYDGASTSATVPLTSGTTYFLRAAAYDAFGKTGLNISTEVAVSSAGALEIPASLQTQISTLTEQSELARREALRNAIQTQLAKDNADTKIAEVKVTAIALGASNAAAIESLTAEVAATYATIESVAALEASVGDIVANIGVSSVAAADQTGAVARWTLRLNATDGSGPVAEGGVTYEAIDIGGTTVVQEIHDVDRFIIRKSGESNKVPMTISGGKVFMDELQVRHELVLGTSGAGGYGGTILMVDGT